MSRVLVAMSGGVDSSVAAAMLAQQGHDVTGVHLKLSDYAAPSSSESDGRVHGCCSVTDADDARRVAQVLDIPFYVWNLSDTFKSSVIDDFVGEYAAGRTPNPCVRCNERVKFGHVLERGIAMGFDHVATGHYAVVDHQADGRSRMYRSADAAKDQSYVLSTIGADALARSLFPIGGLTKTQTRALAADLALRTADKPDSYDICFVPDGDAAGYVQEALGAHPGPIVDPSGVVVGEHEGMHRYTVGQRRGLGLGTAERAYVLEVDAQANTIVVGPQELLARTGITAAQMRWFGDAPAEGDRVAVQIRAHGAVTDATVADSSDDQMTFRLVRPERGIAAGQLLAVYRDDETLGGGTISGSLR